MYLSLDKPSGKNRSSNPRGFGVIVIFGRPVLGNLVPSSPAGSHSMEAAERGGPPVQSAKYMSKKTSNINQTSDVMIITRQY